MAKKKKETEFKDDLSRLKVLQDRLKEIQSRPWAMTREEHKIVEETKMKLIK